jgi:hypothetical protein
MNRKATRLSRGALLVALCVVCLSWTATVMAGEVVLVANGGVGADSVSAEEVKQLFLGRTTKLGGSRVAPVCLKSGATHEAFLREYIGRTEAAYRNHLKKQVFTGKGSMPKTFSSEAELVAYVAETAGAIGYVGNNASREGVKTLTVQ